ncbi:E3 SUMO-protein ligase RanBP2-like, partial [Anthonomus grandis grandis]|uniref:E3 SUMO-protein ligase RanBP2-like n=1 Tax=Anthonomus grandis grandis TaxID=2921223 RepID=UPI00216685E0
MESSFLFKTDKTSMSSDVAKKDEKQEEKSTFDVKAKESTTATSVCGMTLTKSTSEGGSISTPKPDNIFRTAADSMFKTTSATNIFGGGTQNVFGTTDSTNLFGTKKDNIFSEPTTTTPTFPIDDSSKSIFNTSGNIFASSAITTGGKIFGTGNVFGVESQKTTSIFGGTNQGSIFGNPAKLGIGDQNSGQTLFGNKAQLKLTDANLTFGSSTTSNLKETDEPVLKVDSGLSFATLAAKSDSEKPAFASSTSHETPFAFLGAGAPVFSTNATPKKDSSLRENPNKTEPGSDTEDAEVEGGEHDPHFEPIVPLPDQIVVSTGEEEESVIFNERAKLFRYDSSTKEWKERGVGQFKILLHPQNKTY